MNKSALYFASQTAKVAWVCLEIVPIWKSKHYFSTSEFHCLRVCLFYCDRFNKICGNIQTGKSLFLCCCVFKDRLAELKFSMCAYRAWIMVTSLDQCKLRKITLNKITIFFHETSIFLWNMYELIIHKIFWTM